MAVRDAYRIAAIGGNEPGLNCGLISRDANYCGVSRNSKLHNKKKGEKFHHASWQTYCFENRREYPIP